MPSKKKNAPGKAKKKTGRKAGTKKSAKPVNPAKAQVTRKKSESRKAEATISVRPLAWVKPTNESVRITVESIRGETPIGDLLVAFPRTREVLVRNGLRLEAENAGDIYMTLDVFSALNGLRTESLVQDLVDIAKEPPFQQPVPQLAVPPA